MKILCVGRFGDGEIGTEATALSLDHLLDKPSKASHEIAFYSTMEESERFVFSSEISEKFYKQHKLFKRPDLDIDGVEALIIGGSAMPMGTATRLYKNLMDSDMSCLKYAARIAFSPVSSDFECFSADKKKLVMLDHCFVRDIESFCWMKMLGMDPGIGCDLAIYIDSVMTTMKSPMMWSSPSNATLCFQSQVAPEHFEKMKSLMLMVYDKLIDSYANVTVLPFSPADYTLAEMTFGEDVYIEEPGLGYACRQIEHSDLLISLGRRDPLVMALSYETPMLAVGYPDLSQCIRHTPEQESELKFSITEGAPYVEALSFMQNHGGDDYFLPWSSPIEMILARIHRMKKPMEHEGHRLRMSALNAKGRLINLMLPVLRNINA